MTATAPDLLRLVVLPAFAWAAWRDVRTRRLPNRLWYPLAALGALLLAWEALRFAPFDGPVGRAFLIRVAFSVGFVVPTSVLLWRLGAFGGADAKALMTLAVLVPTFPTYSVPGLGVLPVSRTALGVFSLTVLTNTVLVALAFPLALVVRNLLAGDVSPAMALARRTPVTALPERHGRLFEDRDGLDRAGLDLDALRMYCRWRGTDLATLRADPGRYRDPRSVGTTFDPTDGAVHRRPAGPADGTGSGDPAPTGERTDGGRDRDGPGADVPEAGDADDVDDPWGAAAFLDDLDGSAYGTTPATLREGLAVVTERDEVWVSPGLPFVVPMFVGLLVAFAYGDLLFGLLRAIAGA